MPPGRALLPLDEAPAQPPVLKDWLWMEEAAQSQARLRGTVLPLSLGGMAYFAAFPVIYGLSRQAGSCADGPPTAAYAVALLGTLASFAVDASFLAAHWPPWFVPDIWLAAARHEGLAAVRTRHWLLPVTAGKLLLLDALSDATQPAQAAACAGGGLPAAWLLACLAGQLLLFAAAVRKAGWPQEERGEARSGAAAALERLGTAAAAAVLRAVPCALAPGADAEQSACGQLQEVVARGLLQAAPSLYFAACCLTGQELSAVGKAKAWGKVLLALHACGSKAFCCWRLREGLQAAQWKESRAAPAGVRVLSLVMAAWSCVVVGRLGQWLLCGCHRLAILGGCS